MKAIHLSWVLLAPSRKLIFANSTLVQQSSSQMTVYEDLLFYDTISCLRQHAQGMEKENFHKVKKEKLSIRSTFKLILTSFRKGKLNYIANFKIKNTTLQEKNDSLNDFFK